MPTSATGRTEPAQAMRGFTLLEMLVALVIAGIMLSVATLQLMPNAQTVLRDEAQRLTFLLENGALSAQSGGQPLAWSGSGNSYRFWKRNADGIWERIERDALLHARELPQDVHIGELSFNGHRLEPGALIVLSPELSSKAFRIRLHNGKFITDIEGNGLGKVTFKNGNAS